MVEDGYILQSKQSRFAWLSDDLQDPDKNSLANKEFEENDAPELTCEEFLDKIKNT